MRKVKVITDSCSDLNRDLLERYNIDYAKMTTVTDGIEKPAIITWDEDEAHEMYQTMRSGKRITTAQVSVEEFKRIFEEYLKQDYDIVYIACSSKQSGSVNTGYVTAQKLLKDYPNAKISCIDSLNASIGEGMVAIEAAKLAALGKGVDEVTAHALSIRKKVQEFITVHTLEYLKIAGRVSASSAFFGNLMGIKPILLADANGAQAAYKKVKGRQNSIKEIVSLLKQNITDAESQTVYIMHSDCEKSEVESLVELVKSEISCKDIYVGYIGPIIGASVGPDCLGVFAFGNEVTYAAE